VTTTMSQTLKIGHIYGPHEGRQNYDPS